MTAIHREAKQIVPIFSGGGTRLPAHIGILKALDELQFGFRTMVGVSGGSIITALHSAGYSISGGRYLLRALHRPGSS